jgi:protein-S-isoprenylcysteine O-methyltransferase Ste14
MTETKRTASGGKIERLGLKRIGQLLIGISFFIASLFVVSGRWDWTGAWLYLGFWIIGLSLMMVLMKKLNPELIQARSKKIIEKKFDKIFLILYSPLTLLTPTAAGLDVRINGANIATSWALIGLGICIIGIIPTAWAMVANRFFEQTARIQTDRHHKVITTGPYKYIRHPGYTGMIIMFAATPLILQSKWTFIPMATTIVLVIFRTAMEDKMLQNELSGYTEYAAKVRFRLVPGLW